MDAAHLVRMVNRIGDFFVAMPDRSEAMEAIAQHVARFWEPRMRRALYAVVDAGGEGLQPVVLDALTAHREVLLPATAIPLPVPAEGESEA